MFREYIVSRSGYVRLRDGLALGWVVVALLGLTVLLGSASEAAAVEGGCNEFAAFSGCCVLMEPGQTGFWCCTPNSCPRMYGQVRQKLSKSEYWPYACQVDDCSCSCF